MTLFLKKYTSADRKYYLTLNIKRTLIRATKYTTGRALIWAMPAEGTNPLRRPKPLEKQTKEDGTSHPVNTGGGHQPIGEGKKPGKNKQSKVGHLIRAIQRRHQPLEKAETIGKTNEPRWDSSSRQYWRRAPTHWGRLKPLEKRKTRWDISSEQWEPVLARNGKLVS